MRVTTVTPESFGVLYIKMRLASQVVGASEFFCVFNKWLLSMYLFAALCDNL